MWGGSIRERFFNLWLAVFSSIFACNEAHKIRRKTHGGRVNVVMQAVVFSLSKSPE
jgi:hypothetical protein